MPSEGTILEFNAWKNTQRHPIVIYADFEAILENKNEEKLGEKTKIIQKHHPMSYGILVKANDDIPKELLEEYDIPSSPIIYRGSESRPEVGKHFLESIVDISRKIEKLMNTNIPINMTNEDIIKHDSCVKCNLCKCHVDIHTRVRDHDHLTGKFRQTLCIIIGVI